MGRGLGESTGPIPFLDLSIQSNAVRHETLTHVGRIVDASGFVLSSDVGEFERDYGQFLGGAEVIGVSNGTDALELALRALGLEHGAEVLVPANSFVASALAVIRAGLTVRFVDASSDSLLAGVADFERHVTPLTQVVMPVHLYGQCAPMVEVCEFATSRGLRVVEDAAQAQGAIIGNRHAGTFGDIAATSFYPGKNLGAWGDAGGVITADPELARIVRLLRNYGSSRKYHHDLLGFNCRMDAVQAAVLAAKLPYLSTWNDERRLLVKAYESRLAGVRGVETIVGRGGLDDACHLYVVQVDQRDELLTHLDDYGIQALVHYPVPIPRHGAFASHPQHLEAFPVADRAARRVISLPLFPGLRIDQVQRVTDAVTAFVDGADN